MTLIAVGLAAVAAWLPLWSSDPLPRRRRASHGRLPAGLVVAGTVVLGLEARGSPLRAMVTCVLTALAGLVVLRGRRWWVEQRHARALAAAVLEFCDTAAAELRAGRPTAPSIAEAAREHPELAAIAHAASLAADVPAVMRDLASRAGAGELRRVAAAWQVAASAGTPLAEVLSAVADRIRERHRTRRLVASELAGARAAALTMAGLPVLLGLGAGALGADPIGFLVGTIPGVVCLASGLGFAGLGCWWLQRIVARVEDAC